MSDQLQHAITVIKSGDRHKGRQLLANLLKTNPQDEVAWLWMSSVVDTDDQRRYCLTQVLMINSHNELAQRGLEKLKLKNQIESNPITPTQQENIPSIPYLTILIIIK